MNKKYDDIAHPGMLSKPEKHLILAQFTNSPWTRAAGRSADALSTVAGPRGSARFRSDKDRCPTRYRAPPSKLLCFAGRKNAQATWILNKGCTMSRVLIRPRDVRPPSLLQNQHCPPSST